MIILAKKEHKLPGHFPKEVQKKENVGEQSNPYWEMESFLEKKLLTKIYQRLQEILTQSKSIGFIFANLNTSAKNFL